MQELDAEYASNLLFDTSCLEQSNFRKAVGGNPKIIQVLVIKKRRVVCGVDLERCDSD